MNDWYAIGHGDAAQGYQPFPAALRMTTAQKVDYLDGWLANHPEDKKVQRMRLELIRQMELEDGIVSNRVPHTEATHA